MSEYDMNIRIGMEVCTRMVRVPIELEDFDTMVDGGNWTNGFIMSWTAPDCDTCRQSGGRCVYLKEMFVLRCSCPNSTADPSEGCPTDSNKNSTTTADSNKNSTTTADSNKNSTTTVNKKQTILVKKKRVLLVTALTIGVAMILVAAIICLLKKFKQRRITETHVNVDIFLKNHQFLAPKRYYYSQVKKMTNSFKVKLGQGGFGSVYKGELSNGNLVAVKILSELKGNGEDFINEVASVGMTSHVNVVTLVGFCCDGHKRALIYDFMPNGSLERFIYGQETSSDSHLGWEKLHQIAVGIARGLEYLHSGCNTRILHFDIKPHNILLDEDFCPKISDFGLAKLFLEKRSMISMSHMRGTPGYIAPELFSRNFGQVSHKSDVYSYGMMILEMVGGRKNIEVEVDHTSEIYFPHWIYKKVELHEEQLGLHGIVSEEENEMVRKMIIVGLWCIQTNPLSRPTITKVLEMLEDDLASLEIPPKPYLSSPPRHVGSLSTE
ncbi:protein kinase-like domain, Concanavalin A-like lectin/glucanase domain protein [Artemisia annua]|uniref:Protein kinase-like domain, Concanavalin A-like lectin/glucanase domain protein n=1 Tax=Artemisia annua TaxID=35608 RepID=A0A2U1PEJ7_ARTAN|nr:protein kinase-like domain, Concanavalin A-like lectin/glucanase domain protein [Artemisia annua]